jgi:hypothetical protein
MWVVLEVVGGEVFLTRSIFKSSPKNSPKNKAARKIIMLNFLSSSNNSPKNGSKNTFIWATLAFGCTILCVLLEIVALECIFLATNDVSLGGINL